MARAFYMTVFLQDATVFADNKQCLCTSLYKNMNIVVPIDT